MAPKKRLTPSWHERQIEAYRKECPHYGTYAKVLDRVLREACRLSFPDAMVQSRAKSISSFAEKVARKFSTYPDAVHQMTDLCGARVTVQTTEQVMAVRQFIEANFIILEKDDKGHLLSDDEFGYRDLHYVVQLRLDRLKTLVISPKEYEAIGSRKAEVQVRTWLQHAWADTLHDRIYKNKLNVSSDAKRTGALLAALLEEADGAFNRLADELDGLIANYTAFAKKEDLKKEVHVQELILRNEPDEAKKPSLALKLACLLAARGDHAGVVRLLEPYAGIHDANCCELLMELGYGLCRLNRGKPSSEEYARGRRLLEDALEHCACKEVPFVPHLRKRESLYARVLTRLGWILEPISGEGHAAREYYHRAHEHEPANPYYLANMLGFEMFCTRSTELPASIRTTIREAIRTSRGHALAGIELPYAYFTAGRLSLLLKGADDALSYYARGIRHYLEGTYCVPADVLDIQTEWLKRIHFGAEMPPEYRRVVDLLALGKAVGNGVTPSVAKASLVSPTLIITGGAASIDAAMVKKIRPLIKAGLAAFQGTVIAGGTTAGVPGCVGDVAGQLRQRNRKHFRLIGYLPEKLPHGVSPHRQYDEPVKIGSDFLPEQILQNWSDILAAGIKPSDVILLGFGGGPLSAVEYRIALGLGASVGIVTGTGGTTEDVLNDPLWSTLPNLYPLPPDSMTIRAFVLPNGSKFDEPVLEEMAKEFHARYVANNTKGLPDNLKPWGRLSDGFKKANYEQAAHSVQILQAAGFGVRPKKKPVVFDPDDFSDVEVEFMARMEHGRWNVERLQKGWRHGPRDDAKKLHDCLAPWSRLLRGPDGVRKYDRDAVRAFPEILAKAGLEVYRLSPSGSKSSRRPRRRAK